MEAEFTVEFPKTGRLIHFKGIWLCSEYDTLCFEMRESDKTKEYHHLAGNSYIPDEEGIIKEIRVRNSE